MSCCDKEMAARVISYRELGDEERAAVDSHVAECDDCAQTFWALDRFVHKLKKSGAVRRMGLRHPTEEQIIQLALDPKLLSAEQRTKIRQHFEGDRCAPCERIYWSVLKDEKESASRPEERSTNAWQTFFLVWRKPAFALLLAFAVLQSVEISFMVNMKRHRERQEAEFNSRLISANGRSQPQAPVSSIADPQKKTQSDVRPSADAAYVLLLSAGRGADMMPAAKLPPSKLFLILRANLSPELGRYRKYKLVLQDSAGKTVRSDQITQQDGTLNYLIQKEILKPGSYTLQVSGQDGAQEHYLAQFPFRITAAQ